MVLGPDLLLCMLELGLLLDQQKLGGKGGWSGGVVRWWGGGVVLEGRDRDRKVSEGKG